MEWRPIVTTVDRLDRWEVATYVGIVTGEAPVSRDGPNRSARAGHDAVRAMVAAAIERGAHGVIGVSLHIALEDGSRVVVATGTAVTLRNRDE